MTAEGFPAVTLWQPWASLVACGAKTWETRGWPTRYRGRLVIHAAKVERPEEAPLVALPAFHDALWPHLGFNRRPMPASVRERLPRGAVVATANLVDCIPICENSDDADDLIYQTIDGRALYRQRVIGDPSNPQNVISTDLTDQFPFGIWEPGRWAWRLEDIAPTTDRCPRCWGDGGFQEDSMILYGIPGGSDWSEPCPTCNPGGRRTEPLGAGAYGCSPVPAKGGQRIWRWRP